MIRTRAIVKNDNGSTIVIAMLILVFLTIIGIGAINTSVFESQIIGNEHNYQIDFYLADSGVEHASVWLECRGGAPSAVNPNDDVTVKNWGNAPAKDPRYTIAEALADGHQSDNASLSDYNRAYWFQIEAVEDSAVSGSGPDYREFIYKVESRAGVVQNPTQQIETNLIKIYRTGY